MNTTILTGSNWNACGAQCMDIVTAGLITLAVFAVIVMSATYFLAHLPATMARIAGICKRVR